MTLKLEAAEAEVTRLVRERDEMRAELERRIAVFAEANNLHAAFCNQKRAEVAEAEVVRLTEALTKIQFTTHWSQSHD